MTKGRPRLGRGLSALLGDLAEPTAEMVGRSRNVSVTALHPGPFQPRGPIASGSLEELAASIREHGVLQPLLVRPKPGEPDSFEIVGGERRWRAAQAAGLHEVPVLVRELSDAAAAAAALVENLQRDDLNPLEEAQGYARLVGEFGLTHDALAQAVGKSRSHVANTLRLLNLPPTSRRLLTAGELTAGHARALLNAADPDLLAGMVVARGLNVRQTEALATAAGRPQREPRPPTDPNIQTLERELSLRLGLPVTIRSQTGSKGGELVIGYRKLDQLEGLVELLFAVQPSLRASESSN